MKTEIHERKLLTMMVGCTMTTGNGSNVWIEGDRTLRVGLSFSIKSHTIIPRSYSVKIGCQEFTWNEVESINSILFEGKNKEEALVNKTTGKKLLSAVADTSGKYYILKNGKAVLVDDYEKKTIDKKLPKRGYVTGDYVSFNGNNVKLELVKDTVKTLLEIRKFMLAK